MPDRKEYPFYISEMPFTKTTSELDWLRRVVFWRGSSLYAEREPGSSELWDELSHDYKQIGALEFLREYKARLKKMVLQ